MININNSVPLFSYRFCLFGDFNFSKFSLVYCYMLTM